MWLMSMDYFKPIRYHSSATTDWLGIIYLFRDIILLAALAMFALNRGCKTRHQNQNHFFQTPNASGSEFDLACSGSSSDWRGLFLICASKSEMGPLCLMWLENAEHFRWYLNTQKMLTLIKQGEPLPLQISSYA